MQSHCSLPTMYEYILLLTLLILGITANPNVRCYDCDPLSDGGCVDPVKSNNKITTCSDLPPSRTKLKKEVSDIDKFDVQPKTENGIKAHWECFSLYYESNQDDPQPGVYRGCTEVTENVVSSCEFLKEQLKEGNVTDCKTCQDDECNVHDIGRGGASVAFSLVVLLLNAALSLLVFNF